jgi:hypothetical protein
MPILQRLADCLEIFITKKDTAYIAVFFFGSVKNDSLKNFSVRVGGRTFRGFK